MCWVEVGPLALLGGVVVVCAVGGVVTGVDTLTRVGMNIIHCG